MITEVIRITNSINQAVAADLWINHSVDYSVTGDSSQNENGAFEVSKLLIEKHNNDWAAWQGLIDLTACKKRESDDVDCVAYNQDHELKIQVTRVERAFWKELHHQGD